MAERYQGRTAVSDKKVDGDPLAELARLIGQTDPMSEFGRSRLAAAAAQAHAGGQQQREPAADETPAKRPSWVQRAARQQGADRPEPVIQSVHPLHRYPPSRAVEPAHQEAPVLEGSGPGHQPHDPNRYDDALFGQPDQAAGYRIEQSAPYADDPYTYGESYADSSENMALHKRRGGLVTVGAILALAVIGTGGAFAYRTYMGSPRSGEPPIIKADNSPTKVVAAPSADSAGGKSTDRMGGAASEKIVPREEKPVNVKDAANSGPRVVFPPLNQNTNPPSTASVSPGAKPQIPPPSGTLGGDEPRRVRTLAVKGDQVDAAPPPAAKQPVPAARPVAPANANASTTSPLALQSQSTPTENARVALNNPGSAAPSSAASYVVQISSQRSEADAQASYRALQVKFPSVLGSRTPLIKRADLGDKGVYYRALVGPFGTPDEASQFCGSLKSAGGQCVVQRN